MFSPNVFLYAKRAISARGSSDDQQNVLAPCKEGGITINSTQLSIPRGKLLNCLPGHS